MAQGDSEKHSAAEKGKGKAMEPNTTNDTQDKESKRDKDSNTIPDGKDKDKDKPDEEELSEEDQQMKEELEMLVERLQEPKTELYMPSLNHIKDTIRTSTSSMTAVPKPLKFLRPHYEALENLYKKWGEDPKLKDEQWHLADILSILGMTFSDEDRLESLKYRLRAPSKDLGSWGHEYMRHLALELGIEHSRLVSKEGAISDGQQIEELVNQLVPFFLKHNAEADAVDVLTEVEAINHMPEFLDENTYERVCLYMISMVPLLTFPDNDDFLRTAHTIYRRYNRLPQAVNLAIRLNDAELIRSDLNATDDSSLRNQLAFQISRQRIALDIPEGDEEDLTTHCLNNTNLHQYYKNTGKELNVLDPKNPQDIYKTHLESSRTQGMTNVDSSRQNLASAFVNAFVNAGFGQDKLMKVGADEEGGSSNKSEESWIFKTKDEGKISTTASIGLLQQWDLDGGLQTVDAYLQTDDDMVKAGAVLAVGVMNSGVRDLTDPALALLQDQMGHKNKEVRTACIMSLGLAYAGTQHSDVLDILLPYVADTSLEMQLSAVAALSLGFVFVGSANSDISETIVQTFFDEDRANQLKDKWTRFMALGLALLYFGRQEEVDIITETLEAVDHPMSKPSSVLCQVCAWAGTGAVLKLQELLHICNDHIDESETSSTSDTPNPSNNNNANSDQTNQSNSDSTSTAKPAEDKKSPGDPLIQSLAILGLGLISIGEPVGEDMILRTFGHLMHYGAPNIRRAVPLAMGLVSPSNPQMKVYDTLSRYSHDTDTDVAVNAILAMGLLGAGTNNARLAQLLRQLASYYSRDANSLFMVRIAQGLLHLGKGTLTLSPFHTDRQILSRVSAAGLFTVLLAALDPKLFLLSSNHYLLYFLAPSISPRMLVTLDEELKPLKVNVRVGQAVDVVGQAGKPKTITGWQTQSTPVVLAHGERAELEDEKYIPLSNLMEGVVILRKNPEFEEV